jgi:hypothetical protein
MKGLIGGVAAGATIAGVLATLGVFSGNGDHGGPPSFRTAPAAGIPDLSSLAGLAGGVADATVPALRARGPMQTIMQDDATFLYGASDDAVATSMKRAKDLGVDRVRLTAGWSILAPEADDAQAPSFEAANPDAYTRNGWQRYDPIGHWQALDRAVRLANEAGLQVMIDVGFWAPKWATTDDPQDSRRTYNVDPARYAEFVKAVVRRYAGDYVPKYGTLPPPRQTHSSDSDVMHSVVGPKAPLARAASSSSADPGFPYNLLGGGGGGSGSAPPPSQTTPSPTTSTTSPAPAPAPAPATAAKPLPRVNLWTIWNEPNHRGFIQPQWRREGSRLVPNGPYLYKRLVDAGYSAIKGLQPDSIVLVGATSSMGRAWPRNETDGMEPLGFLRALACVDKRFRPITSGPCADFKPLPGDGYSHHPYELLHTPDWSDKKHPDSAMIGDLSRLTNTLNRLAAMHRIDPKIRDVWLTEFGYESNPPDPVKPFTPEEQAHHINWAEYLAWRNPQVKSFPQFLLQDMGKVSQTEMARGKRDYSDWQSGLYFNDGTPKPAATSFALALHVDCAGKSAPRRARGKGKASARGKARARARAGRVVVIWGHLRPGSGPRLVTIETGGRAAFRAAATAASLTAGTVRAASVTPFATDAAGYFLRFAPYAPGMQYRFAYGDPSGQTRIGLAQAPDSCNGKTRQKTLSTVGANEF